MDHEQPKELPNFEPTPVPVKFLITEDIDMSRAAAEFGHPLGALSAQMGFPPAWIDRVIVADTARFGEALAEFPGKRDFTNSHGLVAAAKTIRLSETKPVRSSIIFNLSVVGTVLQAGHTRGWTVREWPVEEQHHFYVIVHELGHCLDHALREEITDDGTWRDEAGNRLTSQKFAHVHALRFSEMYPEIPACVISGFAYSDAMQLVDAKMNNGAFLRMLRELEEMTQVARPDYGAICQRAAAVFWFVLFQHGKFVGGRMGNKKLTAVRSEELWDIGADIPEVAAALREAEAAIETAWAHYPIISPELRPQLIACFHRLSRACGYTLEERHGGEGVWWNKLQQVAARLRLEARQIGSTS
jgi:hypothetical protein